MCDIFISRLLQISEGIDFQNNLRHHNCLRFLPNCFVAFLETNKRVCKDCLQKQRKGNSRAPTGGFQWDRKLVHGTLQFVTNSKPVKEVDVSLNFFTTWDASCSSIHLLSVSGYPPRGRSGKSRPMSRCWDVETPLSRAAKHFVASPDFSSMWSQVSTLCLVGIG